MKVGSVIMVTKYAYEYAYEPYRRERDSGTCDRWVKWKSPMPARRASLLDLTGGRSLLRCDPTAMIVLFFILWAMRMP